MGPSRTGLALETAIRKTAQRTQLGATRAAIDSFYKRCQPRLRTVELYEALRGRDIEPGYDGAESDRGSDAGANRQR